MRIINIIDRFDKVNFGIWNAADSTSNLLKKLFHVDSELWYPKTDFSAETGSFHLPLDLINDKLDSIIKSRQLDPKKDLIVTHGCWQYPTRWGARLKKMGYKWIYVPHGMLEPWSMQQKWVQKKIYYLLLEGRLSKQADIVRAVGSPEFKNLNKQYKNVTLIPNGSEVNQINLKKSFNCINFLFMARLHHKKGILPLIRAWKKSDLYNSGNFKLIIAGPDDGEMLEMKNEIEPGKNIEYVGPVYGEKKEELLKNSHFFVLPSFSEGFPTSVVEAMSFGLIPLITSGCNFPEAFENNLAVNITPDIENILINLNSMAKYSSEYLIKKADLCTGFINKYYSLEQIATQQYKLYSSMIS